MQLLFIEDNQPLVEVLSGVLRRYGFAVTPVGSGEDALRVVAADSVGFSVILCDLGLPDMDGFEVCRELRKLTTTPIIIVTARAEVRARIHGLNLGADDYVTKPFDFGELIARIHAVTRRPVRALTRDNTEGVVCLGPLRVDLLARLVSVEGAHIPLTLKEFDLLALLAQKPGMVFHREQIIKEVWHTDWIGSGRTLTDHVATLRAKLRMPTLIETVRGVGYRLAVPAS